MRLVISRSGRRAVWTSIVIGVIASFAVRAPAMAGQGTEAAWHKLLDPGAGVFVVAHRGCHNAAPARHRAEAPENSLAALENCLALAVDMMETDVRRTRDGALVIMHDETVDRTTSGVGHVSDLSLEDFKQLYLRQNFGGAQAPIVTSQRPLTLLELLSAAKGRILINLDVKEEIYREVTDTVVRAGMADAVLIKRIVATGMPALADAAPYDQLLFMPVIDGKDRTTRSPDALSAVVETQVSAVRRIPAVELISLSNAQFVRVRAAAQAHRLRIWSNTLTSVGVLGIIGQGGDREALRDPQRVWGGLIAMGVSVFQTDEPAALLDYLKEGPLRKTQLRRAD